jgi:hypothetical protein
MTKYPWKRYWCPRNGKVNLSDEGFLYDPESKYGEMIQPDVVPFEKIEKLHCLALLGEPGIGKSTIIDDLKETVEQTINSTDNKLLYINLNEYGDESRLIEDIFKSDKFNDWKKSNNQLHLFLDSLDECKIQIPQVATILINRFRNIKNNLNRLRLRIACRTADWPIKLEESLPKLWGQDCFGAYELVPIRKKDFKAAAHIEGIDANGFLEEIKRTESVALAIKPITLSFLISIFRINGELPKTRNELYEKGCIQLCTEQNVTRQDLSEVGGTGELSPPDRMNIASRLAAVSVFCRKPVFRLRSSEPAENIEEVMISDISGKENIILSNNGIVSEEHIKEVLGTGLFSSRGSNLFGFAHQTYAEFLACRYLYENKIPNEKILSLLLHPSDTENHIVPQLEEVSAWIASQNPEIFNIIANNEPDILLRCDEGALSHDQRAELTISFLSALNESRISDRDWELRNQYKKLNHPNLAEQLIPWLTDKEKKHKARNVVIDIAEACNLTRLQSILADLATDETEGEFLRSNATHAVSIVGNRDTRQRMLPLVLGQAEDDPEDQLKGNALRALWPDIISAKELFSNLTLPKRESFWGSYLSFIEYELANSINKESLPFALQWIESYAQYFGLGFHFSSLADNIIITAWQHMDDPNVLNSLASASIKILEYHHEFVSDGEKREENKDLFNDALNRRRLTKAIVEHGIDKKKVSLLTGYFASHNILNEHDFEWCIQELIESISQPAESIWASLVWTLFRWNESSGMMLDMLIDCRTKSDLLKEESDSFFTPVTLDSEQATKMKKEYNQFQKWQQPKEKKVLDWLPKDRIEHWLSRFENGEQDAWWVLLLELSLEDTSERYEHIFEPDIRTLPGWINSDENIRNRILNSAEIYINSKSSFNKTRLLDHSADEQDIAGYKAFLLLLKERLDVLLSLQEDIWVYWIPILFGPFGYDDQKEIQKLLISIAYKKMPDEVIKNLIEIIQHDIGKKDQFISVLDLVEDIWDQRIANALRDLLDETNIEPLCWKRILIVLLIHDDEQAFLTAESKLTLPLPSNENVRSIALQSALSIMNFHDNALWPLIWSLLQTDEDFGCDLMEEYAYGLHHDFKEFILKLTENDLAKLYIWLFKHFPYKDDPQYNGVHSPTKDDAARELRNRSIDYLEKCGTPNSIKAIQYITSELPELDWMKTILIDAKTNTLNLTWLPLKPEEFLEIVSKPKSALVRNSRELQELLIDRIKSLEVILQGETPAAFCLWDEIDNKTFRPKDENHLSDWIKLNLESEFEKLGIIVAREVEIRQGEGSGVGEKTDIHVTAVIPDISGDSFDQVRVIIEVKGCWHSELKKAMETQLRDRYLKDNDCQHGIYLVGWYVCDQWDKYDYRKTSSPYWTMEKATEFFEKQANELSSNGIILKAVVINTALR